MAEERRSHGADAPLCVTRSGHAVRRNRFEKWSDGLRADAPWAHTHRTRLHVLRFTSARDVERRVGAGSGPVALYLGHVNADGVGTTMRYLTSGRDRRSTVLEAVATTFGPLNHWPSLPEMPVIRRRLPWLEGLDAGAPTGSAAGGDEPAPPADPER